MYKIVNYNGDLHCFNVSPDGKIYTKEKQGRQGKRRQEDLLKSVK